MPSLLASLRRDRAVLKADQPETARSAPIVTVDDFAHAMSMSWMSSQMGGMGPYAETWTKDPIERVGQHMEAYARQLYEDNGLVFALVGVRMLAFSLVRFSFQSMRNNKPGKLFGTPELAILEKPWTGGTTQDLLLRMMQDADIAGNAYITRAGPLLVRLRPDWVQIILAPIPGPSGGRIGWRRVGYTYHDGGIEICPPDEVAVFTADEVAHFAPTPDPLATYRGMSWMQPIVNEVINDKAIARHTAKFFANAATPNLAISLSEAVSPEDFAAFKEIMDAEHVGIDNAYKNLYLGGGADVKVVGANLKEIDFTDLRGGGEVRVASVAHVPPVIAGLSRGLDSSTYSNYSQAMRRFADLTMASLWGNAAGSLTTLLRMPGSDTRLIVDTSDVAYLREDAKDAADIQQIKAAVINAYIMGGFTPESAIAAVDADDRSLLVHTGLLSVQLQPPGVGPDGQPLPGADAAGSNSNGSGSGSSSSGSGSGSGGRARLWFHRWRGWVVPIDGFDRARLRAAGRPEADEHADVVPAEIVPEDPGPAHTSNGAAP